MEMPALRLTPAARHALLDAIAHIPEYVPVVTVVWSSGGSWLKESPDGSERSGPLPAGWSVGFYDPAKVPGEWIVRIDDIAFVFDQGDVSMQLDGKALDYAHGSFVVIDGAI